MCMFLKEKLEEFLVGVRQNIAREVDRHKEKVDLYDTAWIKKALERQSDIGKKAYYLLATGNIISSTGLDLQQAAGYTIVAEKLNHWRYLSHFRSVHRGQFFTEMKTTQPRKLLPDSWGFLCCVHTPDGAPCGLLNHLTATCSITTDAVAAPALPRLCQALGMVPADSPLVYGNHYVPVFFNGQLLGRVLAAQAAAFCDQLRLLKLDGARLPASLEIVCVPAGEQGGPWPCVYLSTDAARMQRPVRHLGTGKTEWIGPLEQVYLEIACVEEDIRKGVTTHIEVSPANMLSLIASLTPFSDFNQSPRNMYQCQMGKQTMGTPGLAWTHRTDTKMYRLQTPQAPIVHNALYREFLFDSYPQGMNSVVAVISYTGYDLEDAMILNKSSFERGFAHASVYKSHEIDLVDPKDPSTKSLIFKRPPREAIAASSPSALRLDPDGLPPIGLFVQKGDAICAVYNTETGKTSLRFHDSSEPAYVDEVRILDGDPALGVQRVNIKFRYNRNPVVGDKFSSRHGQKGVLSVLWPQVDMPFTASGITPDCIINPNAFPSRMTIGMLIESMAGKSGALHGQYMVGDPRGKSSVGRDAVPVQREAVRGGLLRGAAEGGGVQLLRERAAVLGHLGRPAGGGHLHRRGLLPATATHGREEKEALLSGR